MDDAGVWELEKLVNHMNFKLSQHAQNEIQRRNIPLDLLNWVLANPQQIILERYGRKVYQSQVNFGYGKLFLLRAIVIDNQDSAIVVTVYKTSKIHKYWKSL